MTNEQQENANLFQDFCEFVRDTYGRTIQEDENGVSFQEVRKSLEQCMIFTKFKIGDRVHVTSKRCQVSGIVADVFLPNGISSTPRYAVRYPTIGDDKIRVYDESELSVRKKRKILEVSEITLQLDMLPNETKKEAEERFKRLLDDTGIEYCCYETYVHEEECD